MIFLLNQPYGTNNNTSHAPKLHHTKKYHALNLRLIRQMSDDDLPDMDYFLNDDELDDEFGEEGFYIF